jgi:hypothetical protein
MQSWTEACGFRFAENHEAAQVEATCLGRISFRLDMAQVHAKVLK